MSNTFRNTFSNLRLVAAAALAISLAPSFAGATQRPIERTVHGVVVSVDSKSNVMTVKVDQAKAAPKMMTVAWKSATQFEAANGARAKADMLKAGMAVDVRYRSLILGNAQASRVAMH